MHVCTILQIILLFLCRAVGCIFGELLNNSPLFPVSILEILVDRSDTKKKKLFLVSRGLRLVTRPSHYRSLTHCTIF